MGSFQVGILAAVFGVLLIGIIVFFLRLRHTIKADISLWGIYLLVALLVLFGMGELTYQFLLPSLPKKSSYFLIDNLLIVMEVFCAVSVYRKHQDIDRRWVVAFFTIFLVLWVGELWYAVVRDGKNRVVEIDRLRITPVFWRLVAVLGTVYFFVELYRKQYFRYLQMPFFWLATGWFIEYTLTSTSFFQEIKTASQADKQQFVLVPTLGNLLGNLCYLIAFWKTKKWTEYIKTQDH